MLILLPLISYMESQQIQILSYADDLTLTANFNKLTPFPPQITAYTETLGMQLNPKKSLWLPLTNDYANIQNFVKTTMGRGSQ